MMKRFLYTCLLILGTVCTLYAQIDPLFFQQTNNRVLINPASTGKGGDIIASLSARQQWIGFPGPSTQALNVNSFAKQIHLGYGLTWINDKFGPQQTNNIKLNYAYFVSFEDAAFLSFGLGMGVMNNTYNELGFFARPAPGETEIIDPSLTDLSKQTKTIPDFDFGIEFDTRQFEIGASVTHLTYMYADQGLLRPMRNLYAYTRFKVPMNPYWDFIPGVTWHNTRRQNTFEANVSFRYENSIYVNFVYRNPVSCGIAFGVHIYKVFRLSYSYDYGFDNLSSYNNGSHEVTVSYTIPLNTTYVDDKLRFFKWKMF